MIMDKIYICEEWKNLISLALKDRWDAVTGCADIASVEAALDSWEIDIFLVFLEQIVLVRPNEFHISWIQSGGNRTWVVKYIFYTVYGSSLKMALFRLLQECLSEGKVRHEYLEFMDKKYLNFFSQDYGFE